MIPNLILQKRIISGIEKISSYNYEFMINSLSILVFIITFLILFIKRFQKKTDKEKKKNLQNFYQKVLDYTN